MPEIKIVGRRMKSLLKKAAVEYKRGSNPFETWWLSENEVTLDECMSLSETIATVLEWFVNQPAEIHAEVIFHEFGPLARHLALDLKSTNTVRKLQDLAGISNGSGAAEG